jgi:acyl-CoA dehydrogenase
VRDALHRAQEAIEGVLSNFPVKPVATLLRWMIFPRGKKLRPPLDSRNRECAQIALEPGAARERLTAGMYVPKGDDATGVLEAAFLAAVACEPIEKKLREAQKRGLANPLTPEEKAQWERKEALRKEVIRVDDFPPDFGRAELVLSQEQQSRAAKAA